MSVTSSEKAETPRYMQMARELEEQIQSGLLPPGCRLPSFGQLRKEHGVGLTTVERVYASLEKKGLIRREAKRGIFVAEPRGVPLPLLEVVTYIGSQQDTYYAQILRGIQEEAGRQGAEILLSHMTSSRDWSRTDGVIVLSITRQQPSLLPRDMPCVAVMAATYSSFPTVRVDDVSGVTAAMEHLFELGHRRIAFLTFGCWREGDQISKERLRAYHLALRNFGITSDDRWVRSPITSGLEVPIKYFDTGHARMTQWLQENWRELGCTAILVQNDEMAVGAMQAIQDAGLHVPGDISVVGFDGTALGAYIRPNLTSVSIPLIETGATAVAMVLEQIRKKQRLGEDKMTPTASEMLPVGLIVRDSTGPAPHERGD